MLNCNVEDICVGQKDSQGLDIVEVCARKVPEYAVYRTMSRVCLQFADESSRNATQRKAMAPLNPLRGEINGLLDGWRESRVARDARKVRAIRYDRRVGDALLVAFEEDVASASVLLATIKQDILNERLAWARFEYLIWAFGVGAIAALSIWVVVDATGVDHDGHFIWHAAAAGTLGAFFSIALGVRGRTILPDMQRVSNTMDATLRIVIGVIAAAVLAALVLSKAVTIAIGTSSPSLDPHGNPWLYFLIIGFIAGFSERLVPDLLAKAIPVTDAQKAVPPVSEKKAANTSPPATPADATKVEATTGAAAEEPDPLPGEAATDNCACAIDLPDAEATKDADLPAATGGVAPSPAPEGVDP